MSAMLVSLEEFVGLKPCPCCGGKPRKEQYEEFYRVSCCECGMNTDWLSSINEAVDVWNSRAHQDEPALFTKIKSLIEYLEEKSYGAEISYLTYGEAEDRAEHCAYKDAARKLREIAEAKSNANV